MRISEILKWGAVFSAFFMVLASSCDKYEESTMEVSVKNPVVSSTGGQMFVSVICSGEWTLSLTSFAGEVDWAYLDITSGKGDRNNIILTYDVNDVRSRRTLVIVLDNGARSVTCKVTQEADDQVSGGNTPSGGGESGSQVTAAADWLELPAMNDSGLDYYSHSFTMNGKTYRNYTFGWNKSKYVAEWVAYPLSSVYLSGSASGGDWVANPLFNAMYQPDFSKSFGFSKGYERGHQIANADRKCSKEANGQTYYFTNSTLQHKNFNGKIWAKLESNMRDVVGTPSDTCYVVTGCVLSRDPEYIQDGDGKMVAIPSAYFKAALRYKPGSTFGTWLSAGFYLEHKTYPYEYISESEVMTVDQLEAKLGMDFFVNLPDKLGQMSADAVEAQNPCAYKTEWNIK